MPSASRAELPAVQASGLIKRFGPFTALDGLDLTIPRGAFYAFLGPNGAGKSTTIAMLTGIYGPDAGHDPDPRAWTRVPSPWR